MDILLNKAIDNFDIIEFLDVHNIDYALDGENIGTGWIGITPCPECGAELYHLGLHQNSKVVSCWKCGFSTNLIGFISKIKGISYKSAREYVLSNSSELFTNDIFFTVSSILFEKPKTFTYKKVERLKIPKTIPITDALIERNKIIRNFLNSRKLTLEKCNKYSFRICTEEFKGRLFMPIVNSCNLIAFQLRSLFEKNYKSYGPLKTTLYRMGKIKKNCTLFLVEGIFDYISTSSFLINHCPKNYCATTPFSKILTYDQAKLINKLNPLKVIYMLDNDSWFDYNKSNARLNCPTDFLILPRNTDPGNLSTFQFLDLFRKNGLL